MKPVLPDLTEEVLPPNVELHKFEHPSPNVDDIFGLVYKAEEEGESNSIEFMFELTNEELDILKVKPLLTITILGDAAPVFALMTSYPSVELAKRS